MLTDTLYYKDSHLCTFTSRVTGCEPWKDGYKITLEDTAFYPEGGGQAGDTGSIAGVRVLDTRLDGEQVVHICDGPLEIGREVAGQIDWEQRFGRMQQHSGEHIVSGLIYEKYGYHNVGFHMNDHEMVIDFDGVIPNEDLPELERLANEAVWKNIPLHIWVPSPEELSGVDYRTKKQLPWPVRIVEVPGYDSCACCGTHVKSTGEIGLIKFFSAIPCRGGTRMEMACGRAAYLRMNKIFEENRVVSRLLSVPMEGTGEGARRLNEQMGEQKAKCAALERKICAGLAEGCRDGGNVLLIEDALSPGALRELCDGAAEICGGTAAVFSQGNYCLGSRREDLRPLGKAMHQALGGRGGGKPGFQQGRVAAEEKEIRGFFEAYWGNAEK